MGSGGMNGISNSLTYDMGFANGPSIGGPNIGGPGIGSGIGSTGSNTVWYGWYKYEYYFAQLKQNI